MKNNNKNIIKTTMYSTSWCGDCFRAKQFFDEHSIDYKEINIEENPDAASKVEKINNGNRSVPTIVIEFKDKEPEILVEPSNEELRNVFENII